MDAGDVGTLISAFFAAVAASASWASVHQGRKAWLASTLPELHAQPFDVDGKHVHVRVHNSGGMAKGCGYVLASGDHYVVGHMGDGLLPPGATVDIRTTMPPSDKMRGVLTARDIESSTWVWDVRSETKKRLATRKQREQTTKGYHDAHDLFGAFYSERLDRLQHHPSEVAPANPGLRVPRTTTVRSERSTVSTVVRTVTVPTATTAPPPRRPTRPTTSRAEAESAARNAANTYTTDRYSIGGKAGDWSANCHTAGEDWACHVAFNQTECTGSVVIGGQTLRTLGVRVGCSE